MRSGPIGLGATPRALLPVALLIVVTAVILARYNVQLDAILWYAAYLVVLVVLPGTLWVRLLRGRGGHLAEDAALGLAAGSSLQVAAYLVALAAGVPQAHVAWAIGTLILFAAHPELRRRFRGSGERAPAAWTWAMCGLVVVVLVRAAAEFAANPIQGPATPYVDMPFHLSLIGELRHHLPPLIPYVTGEPLAYHWFWYAQAAAVSWTTGIEPVVLLYRLDVLPMVIGFVLLTAFAARRVTNAWWPAPIAAALALFVSLPSPWSWARLAIPVATPILDAQPLESAWLSPTHAFGLLLTGGVLLVLLDLLGDAPVRRPGVWLLLGILVFGAAGAKATTLPVFLGGLVAVLAVSLVRSRRIDRDAALGAGIVAVGFVFAVTVLFRGVTGGLLVGLGSLRQMGLASAVGASRARGLAVAGIPAIVLGITAVLWAMQGAAVAPLVAGSRNIRDDRRLWLLVGMILAAIGAATFLDYPGLSQWYYLRGAAAVPGILIAWGAWRLLGPTPSRGAIIGTAIGLAAGAAIVLAIRQVGPEVAPQAATASFVRIAAAIVIPVLALAGTLAVATVALRAVLGRRLGVSTAVLAVAVVSGTVLPGAVLLAATGNVPGQANHVLIPADGIEAARWLRANSSPDDLVATNMHCLAPPPATPCDARHFWVSAYAERRILVEGWDYTATSNARYVPGYNVRTGPFWDPALLALNDAAFTDPASGVPALRATHPVRWLFADLQQADEASLGLAAVERFRAGRFAVYEVARP
jgi:hypothetical protein